MGDKFMEEYDQMAELYIQQMTDKHQKRLREFQEETIKAIMQKQPKFSRELLDWRRRQHLLARQKNYAEAEKIKRLADTLEARETQKIGQDRKQQIKKLEAQFRQDQQKELTALLKRIDGRRKDTSNSAILIHRGSYNAIKIFKRCSKINKIFKHSHESSESMNPYKLSKEGRLARLNLVYPKLGERKRRRKKLS